MRFLILFVFLFSSFGYNPGKFGLGEAYDYKIKYGFIPIGVAQVKMNENLVQENNKSCYKVNVVGRTTGITDIFKVRNTYRSYIDTKTMLPQRFELNAREGSYKRDQLFYFHHNEKKVERLEKAEKTEFNIPSNALDVISGYYYLRTINYENLSPGQYVSAPLFFDDKVYQMKIKYVGRDVVNTRFGKIKVVKLHPILPKNDLFEGEEAIRVWVSDDANRVPIRLEVDFAIAAVNMELADYKNTKHGFKWF